MKKLIFSVFFLVSLFLITFLFTLKKVRFSGYLDKNEKVELIYMFGLKSEMFSFEELKNDKLSWHDNFIHFSAEVKIPWFLGSQKFTLKHYYNNNCVIDSTYNLKNNLYPIYLIGVLHPHIYQKMLTNGDDVSNHRFYFKTKQDDIDLEIEIKKIQAEERQRRIDSLKSII